MTFQWPAMLWLLLLNPVLIAAYIITLRRRQKYPLRYASLSLVKPAVVRRSSLRRHIPPALFLIAMAAMTVALARPTAVVALPSHQGTVILLMDVSGSMQANDLQPSRMEAAKDAARAFVDKQPNTVQIGVVSFTDNASILQMPTDDKNAVLDAIDRLQPQRGTGIGRGLLMALDAISAAQSDGTAPRSPLSTSGGFASPTLTPTPVPQGHYEPAIIVLMTDGENNMFPDPLLVIDRVVNRGIRVFTIGVGTAAGTVLHIEGQAILTRLDEPTLREIAQVTGGQYYNATTATDLRSIYENLSTRLVIRSQEEEMTVGFTAVAGLALLLGTVLSMRWSTRLP